jgi:hypothetical protein
MSVRVVIGYLACVAFATAYQIRYNDCRHVTNIMSLDRQSLCGRPPVATTPTLTYDLLQMREIVTLEGWSCQVTRSVFTLYCGAFSHLKMIDVPKISEPVSIPPDQCAKMVRDREFKSPSGTKYRIELDRDNVLDGAELGALTLTGGSGGSNCQGQQAKIKGKVINGVMELDSYHVVVLKEKYESSSKSGKMVALHSHKEIDCAPAGTGCISGSRTYVWKLPLELCPYEKVKSVAVTLEGGFYIDHQTKLVFKSLGSSFAAPRNCPVAKKIRPTHHHRLFLADKSMTWPALLDSELDITLQIKLSAEYVSYQLSNTKATSLALIDKAVCDRTSSLVLSEDVFKLHNTTFGRVRGDLLYVFECPVKLGSVVSSETCITDLKLAGDAGYVNPDTRVWKQGTAERSCQAHFPTAFRATNNVWFQAEPVVKALAAPSYKPLMEVQAGSAPTTELFDESTGLYTLEELQSWKNSLVEAGFARDVTTSMNYGLCQNDEGCQSNHRYNSETTYSLNNLIPAITSELDFWGRAKKWLEEQAALLCLLVLVLEGLKMLTYLVSFFQNLWKDGLCAALFCIFNCLFPAWPVNKPLDPPPGYHQVPASAPGVGGMEMVNMGPAVGPGLPPRVGAPGYPAVPTSSPFVPISGSGPIVRPPTGRT